MRSYLSLIPVSAKVHKRRNRMTLLCISISVLLVTAIFSMADMIVRTENEFMLSNHGRWHFSFDGLPADIAEEISSRPDVEDIGWSEKFNEDAELPWFVGGKKAALCGADETYITKIMDGIVEGSFPQNDNEAILTENAKIAIHAKIGDSVTVHTPAGDREFTVSGFGSDDNEYYKDQTYLIAVTMTQTVFASLMEENGIESQPICYVQFKKASDAVEAVEGLRIKYQLPESSISENTGVMGLAGQSSNQSVNGIYQIAAVVFCLVLLAGVLMISGSMNSSVASRTQFFGMLRCIGASREQVIRFVRLEALNWCKTAIPAGMVSGTLISWAICLLLHYGIGGEFATTPVFKLSPIGLISGVVVGITTVLLAAQAPAKRAAKVSPMAAVSGHDDVKVSARHSVRTGFGRIDLSLGVHHATASKKNWVMMTASFSLSIILFLCFSVAMDFARELIPTLRSWQPDITLGGYSNALILDREMCDEIAAIPGVKQVFGSSYVSGVPAECSREGIDHVNIVSYSDFLLDSSKDRVIEGDISLAYGDSDKVMTVRNKDNPLQFGDTIRIGGDEIKIACTVSDGLFGEELIVICSQEAFDRLMGKQKFNLIGVQLDKDATDETVMQISNLAVSDVIFTDMREGNRSNESTYWATRLVGYCFLAIIAMITVVNIINSIAMSVSARVKQYGAMRAVGMSGGQLTRMIAAEALTYAFSGLAVGGICGLLISRLAHIKLLTQFFGIPWRPPMLLLCVIFVFIMLSAAVAVIAPAKRMLDMAVVDTINEL